ncbi:MAG: sigma 54-interacting transcriptional regulator, partial [Bacillota bacterium]|nr:sigma 54-interacting transcriptional regulator [Bacillota bacterium]
KKIDGAPVVKDGTLVGLITKTHLLRSIAQRMSPDTPIKEVMSTRVITASPEDDIRKIDIIYNGRYPVVDEDHLVGFISKSDIMLALYQIIDEMSDQMETVINSAYNPIIAIDTEGIIGIWNEAASKLIGIQSRDVIGIHINDVVPESNLLSIVETGQSEFGIKLSIGNTIFITNRAPVKKDNQIFGAVAVLYDISDLEQISIELEYVKMLNKEMDAIIDSSFDGLYITDGEGKTIRINKAIKRITDLGEEELLYKTMYDLVDSGMLSNSASIMVLEKKEPVTTILSTVTGIDLLVSATPIYDERGHIYRIVTNVRDISELNLLKQKVARLEGLKNHIEFQMNQLKIKLSDKLIYSNQPMETLIYQAIKIGEVDSTVLISGESGVGKELIAGIVHGNSKRNNGPFVKVNCAAIPENLLESELFGYESGAFTGARREGKPGLFEVANTGTLMLDEIGDLPLHLQVKLLRVLQEREITRVGGTHPIKVDVRIIAVSNKDLGDLVKKELFREDLYYRLNVIPLHVPALKERKNDIPLLVQYFIEKFNKRYSLTKKMLPETIDALVQYNWPGNIRQLENLIERLVVTCNEEFINKQHIPSYMLNSAPQAQEEAAVIVNQVIPLRNAVETVEQLLLKKTFHIASSCNQAAEILEVDPSTISRKARKYGLKLEN